MPSMLEALAGEFADATDAASFARILFRLALAALLGGLLGYQRERHGKAAGVRTHMLVALGAALFILVPERAGTPVVDLTRVIQGVAVGIGFLGAGAIVKHDAERSIQGLTTAAGIWLTAATGLACGSGRAATAIVSAVLAFVVLALVPHIGRVRDK